MHGVRGVWGGSDVLQPSEVEGRGEVCIGSFAYGINTIPGFSRLYNCGQGMNVKRKKRPFCLDSENCLNGSQQINNGKDKTKKKLV